ncbi:C39 family peptidase [Okeania sp. KiyG1]|uniref:C39 family peptidase n=1 Tax=Okeania sp. KiyG1 TaxID=2720165 RepID=UPI0019245A1C|nr:C39 family peptidase [Okeania sp. KiyG1]
MKLSVPYYSQIDNRVDWWRTCNASSIAMCLKFLKPEAISGDDDYIDRLAGYGDTTDHFAHTRLLADLGVNSEWKTDLSYADLDAQLDRGKPVPIGVLHKGTLNYPTGGHICVVVGKEAGGYICHDPWGHGFSYNDHNGKDCYYPYQSLDARWLVEGANTGWGRMF